jgi:hypothetical protein
MTKEEIYEIDNPMFLADTFIFSSYHFREEIHYCFIKVNCDDEIEEIGADISARLFGHISIDKIIKQSRKATKKHRSIYNVIGYELWVKVILRSR